MEITHLRCEYLVEPLGLDERCPRLSWRLETGRRGARQTAYRVLVSSTAQKLAAGEGDRWDSGRVEGDRTTHVAYAGAPLGSRHECHWRVEVWDEMGAHVLSAPSRWTMGLLDTSDWTACWIAADPEIYRRDPQAITPTPTGPGTPAVFERHFAVATTMRRATLHASARGVFALHANGHRVGTDLFAPEWTDYDKRIHYRTYDVSALLTPGMNVLKATLGDGWFSGFVGWQETRGRYGTLENSLLLQLEVELTDGTRMTVGTDGTWQCATGPILSSDFQMGECYDARRVTSNWMPARAVAPPSAVLVSQRSEPVRITEERKPVSCREAQPGIFVHDLGQNISGFVRLRVRGLPAGVRLTLRHGERLNPDGTLYTGNLRRARATDVYITGGRDDESFTPHFTFHGFQFVELTGYPGVPPAGTVTGCALHSALAPAGHFECSHAGVNRLWLNGVWSQRDNFISVPTDCPQRDERLGWTGDAQVFLRTASYNLDVAAFFTKWMSDVEDAQTVDGVFPDVAPRLREDIDWVGLDGLGGAAGWADAGVIVPYTLWRVYGDTRIIERHWRAMSAWLDWIERGNPDYRRTRGLGNNYGDWLCIPSDTRFRTQSPMKNLLATAYWAADAAMMSRMARALGRELDATRFATMFERVRRAFQEEFLLEDGRLKVETQTAYLLALTFDLLPAGARARVAEHLVENIRGLDWHLSTGFIGVSLLNPQLTLAGHADVAYRLLLRDDYPSWLYPVRHGATTIWERWNGWTHQEGFFDPQMNSFNHYSLGSVGEWLFRHVGGIELEEERPGFQHFVLRPFIGPGLDFARATYRTMHGQIESHWRREKENLTWNVRVPPNCTARVFIPTREGFPADTGGLPLISRGEGWTVCSAPAGRYEFHTTVTVTNPRLEG